MHEAITQIIIQKPRLGTKLTVWLYGSLDTAYSSWLSYTPGWLAVDARLA